MATQRYNWANDKSRFGLKLMEKMGWKEGKGLGKEEDGCVESVKPQRMGSETGIGAKTKAETSWLAPGVLASGLNDVLARLAPVGTDVSSKQSVLKDATQVKADSSQKCHQPRGFYERRRARKNIGTYSQSQLAEIFGGVQASANVGSTNVKLTCTAQTKGGTDAGKKTEENRNVVVKAEFEKQCNNNCSGPEIEDEGNTRLTKEVSKDVNIASCGDLAVISVREDFRIINDRKAKKRDKKKKSTKDLHVSDQGVITKPSKKKKFKLKHLSTRLGREQQTATN